MADTVSTFPKNRIPVDDETYSALEKARAGVPLYKFAKSLLTSKKYVRVTKVVSEQEVVEKS